MGIFALRQRDGATNRFVALIAEETTRLGEPVRSNRRPATVAMSACEKLPQELIMAIAGNIRDDQKSLKAFSLVCKAWTNPARDYLFASLTIADFTIEKVRAENIISIYAPFLRHLSLIPIFTGFWHWMIPILAQADFSTPRLQSLDVKNLAWHSLSPDERSVFLRRFESIISLRLSLNKQNKPDDIGIIICSFPHLHELTLGSNWNEYELPGSFPLSPELRLPKQLSVLHLFNFCQVHRYVLEWLGSNPEPLSIRTFRVTMFWFSPHKFDGINLFLKILGSSLEIFGCNFVGDRHFVDLTYNTHLRRVDFRFGEPENRCHEMLSAISTLSRIQSQQLEQVAFHFRGLSWRDRDVLHTEWINLDATLASSQFAQLKSVRMLGHSYSHDLSALVATLLPICHARGIISFVVSPSWSS